MIVLQRGTRHLLATTRGSEVGQLCWIRVGERRAAVGRELVGAAGGQDRDARVQASRREQRRPFAADHLEPDLEADPRRAAQLHRRRAALVADRHVDVVGSGVGRVHRAVTEGEDCARILAEQPARGVEVVDADVHDEPAAVAIAVVGRIVLAGDRLNRERLADRAVRDQPRELAEPRVVPAVIGDADHEVRVARRLLGDLALSGHGGRAGLLEQQMLAGLEYVERVLGVIARARREQYRLDFVVGPELLERQRAHVLAQFARELRAGVVRPCADATATRSTASLATALRACI